MQWTYDPVCQKVRIKVTYLMATAASPKLARDETAIQPYLFAWSTRGVEKIWVKFHFHTDHVGDRQRLSHQDDADKLGRTTAIIHAPICSTTSRDEPPSWTPQMR